MASRVDLAQIKLIRSYYAANIHFRPAEDERIIMGVAMKHSGEFMDAYTRAHFLQRFQIEQTPDGPFALDVEFGALFLLEPAIMPQERDYYLRRVFPQIMFPYMREYVAEITRRGGFSPLMLGHGLFESFDEPERSMVVEPDNNKWIH